MNSPSVEAPLTETAERRAIVGAPGSTPDPKWVIVTRGIKREYDMGGEIVRALRGIDLAIGRNEYIAIMGPSGSGKSTLMNIIGCLDRPTGGEYRLAGTPIESLTDDDLARVRGRSIGFGFQSVNLLPRPSALENVATPLLSQGVGRRERHARAAAVLERLGLSDRATHEPSELSGGQQQRVAIARALVGEPALILADEPTGHLDSASGAEVIELLHELNGAGTTIVLITHDTDVAEHARRQVHVRDGLLVQ